MIIPDSIKHQYEKTRRIWEPIKFEVDGIFQEIVLDFPSPTAFNSRIKPIESVLLKAQKGGYQRPFSEMEDFFACELLLPLTYHLGTALERIVEEFEVEELAQRVRPPYDFSYSGNHYLLLLSDSPLRGDKSVLDKVFELQIKTYLQSAWQQAVHKIVYKPNRISYWTERITGQLRGLLELADGVLAQIEETANLFYTQSKFEEDNYKPNQKRIIDLMQDNFEGKRLPYDKRRMAVIIQNFIGIAGISVDELEEIIIQAKAQSDLIFGFLTINPIEQVFILIFQQYEDKVMEGLDKGRHRVLITPEMEDFYPTLKELPENGRAICI